jgi:hypothetical protein
MNESTFIEFVPTLESRRRRPTIGGQICDICLSITHSKSLIIFRKFSEFLPFGQFCMSESYRILFAVKPDAQFHQCCLLSSQMHNSTNVALGEVSTAAYNEQQTHLLSIVVVDHGAWPVDFNNNKNRIKK